MFMNMASYDGVARKGAKSWKPARSLGWSFSTSRVLLALLIALVPHDSKEQVAVSRPIGESQASTAEPALPAILKIFRTFEVVGLPAAHGQKDVDDFILSLIRDPRFSGSVNDIVVECGNVRYQPILDHYIAGENVSFTEVQHVWRDTTQPMCGESGFFEQLYPLVRAMNQQLPAAKRLRVLAADPPIDWTKVQTLQDITPFFDRDGSIASVMEKEVLSKHRKALMLFGVFHLLHGSGPEQGDAVTIYERHYPGKTFVISDLGYYSTNGELLTDKPAALGTGPSLLRTKNSRLGSLGLGSFLPTPLTTDQDCNVVDAFAGKTSKTVSDLLDAFLYLGPQSLQLREPIPADIALDHAYRAEWLRRLKVSGLPGPSTLEEVDAEIVASAADPIILTPRNPDAKELYPMIKQGCLMRKNAAPNTKP
ncbi:hypothetical protein [Terriglobus sp.]|uniref:hypothetical protein n=1 Tax=Terriglobus sp. TaxID=1889013 RepID=UPI003AFF9724